MRKKRVIQKLVAVWLLLVFAVSATPRAYFHDLLADHKDDSGCLQKHSSSAVLHQEGYHCHFDDLVVSVPFVLTPAVTSIPITTYCEPELQPLCTRPATPFLLHQENRGPPRA